MAAVEGAVFVPFRLRFPPFIGRHDGRKTPSFRAFPASALENSV
jgi:hypothetical protein